MFAFDVAYDVRRVELRELLGQPVGTFNVDSSKRSPKQLFFYRPQTVRLPPTQKFGPHGLCTLNRTIKIMPVGAISITVQVSVEVEKLSDLVQFHDLKFNDGSHLSDDIRALGEQIRRELHPYLINPVSAVGDVEAYTVFCLEGPVHEHAEDWLKQSRRDVAALLTQETDAQYLSEQEATESTSRYFSYYQDDVIVMDWDAALMVDDPREWDESLYIMELANVQLAELEAYDRLLDDVVERAYRDLRSSKFGFLSINRVQKNLRELRIDAARLNDELQNITKFFGDWHLARLYQGIALRFHLEDWQKSIAGKLRAVDDLYQLIHADQNTRWMFILEISIVVLFVVDIVKSLWHW